MNDDQRLEGALRAAKAALVTPPSERAARQHLQAIAEAAALVDPNAMVSGASRPARRRAVQVSRRLALIAAAGIMGAAVSTGGLALVGVDLPGTAAERAFEAVLGVSLPNQGQQAKRTAAPNGEQTGDEEPRGEHGRAVSSAASDPDKEPGCEFGQGIAEIASSKFAAKRSAETARRADPCDKATASQRDSRGAQRSAEVAPTGGRTGNERAGEAPNKGRSRAVPGRGTSAGNPAETRGELPPEHRGRRDR